MKTDPGSFSPLAEELNRLQLGDHLCSIYRDFEEQMEVIVPFFAAGLARGQRCLYLADRTSLSQIVPAFRARGVNIEEALASDQLLFLTTQESYLLDGRFDPERMIATLQKAEREARESGYSGLRATGEMSWILAGLPGSERLIEYESRLNDFFPGSHTVAICQYQEDLFPPDLLLQVIHSHPRVLLHAQLCPNPYYLPPQRLLPFLEAGQMSLALYGAVRDHLLLHRRIEAEQQQTQARLQDLWQQSERSRRALLSLLEDEKRTSEALRLSQARYQALVEQSPDAIYLVDPRSKRLLEANPAFCRMTGYSPEEVTSLTVHDLIAAEREDIDERFAAVLSGRILSPYERTYRRKDGSLFPVEVSARLISYADQELVSALVRDLSQKKALESQLLRAQRMESIGLLAGGIAHDLNNILSPILMNAELLQQELPESHLLHSILASAQRGAEIVRQILTFARGMEEKKDLLSPLPLLKELARFLQETFPPSIRIRTEVEKDLWYLSANPTQLHQLLLNLCLNAKEAMEKGGELILRAENRELDPAFCAMEPEARPGPYLLLQVTDTGSGIPEEHLSRICDPFFTTKEKGTGLGLFTVSTIVRAHGGFYKVRSQVQKGTEFSVFLPALPGGRKAPCPEEEGPLPAGQGELILLAEDEASVREIVQAALEGYGYQVVAAPEGASALSLYALHRDKVRLLLTDLIMPALEGSHLIRALRQLDPTLPVMVMTGAEMEERKRELDQLGIQALLPKPFTVERLLREVSRVLSGKDPAPGPGGG
jgi:PAS domain S-box-containing protein